MDRVLDYVGQVPLDTDLLNTNKNTMVGLGYLIAAVLGTAVSVDGLACTPTLPASMTVQVGPGAIHSLQNVDGTAYGSLAADTVNQIMKQGLNPSTQTLACPAPATTGQSVVYLIQVAYQDTDAGAAVLPYYNASSPGVPWAGPNNTGVSQNTVRKGVCLVGVKAGVAATTGTQAIPAPDAGYTGLYAVTVANGQTTITSGNIAQLSTAPFIGTKLPAVLQAIQQGVPNYAEDTSGVANTIAVSLSPVPPGLTKGMPVRVKVANTNTGAVVINLNGLGNVSVVTANGSALAAGSLVANGIYTLVYDANGSRWQVQGVTAAAAQNGYFFGTGTTGGANAQVLASVTPSGFTKTQGNAVGFTAGFTNTGPATLNVNGTGVTSILINTTSGLANLTGGELVYGESYVVYYNGANYVLIDPSTLAFLNSPAFSGTPTAPTPGTGDNSTRLATTAFVKANTALGQMFTSSQQTISVAGALTIPHGLGVAPTVIWTYIVCQTAEYGWSAGDSYLVSFGGPYGGTSSTAEGAAISFDATNIYVRWSNDVPLNNLMNKSTGGYAPLTPANWKLVVKAFA